jgi:hypothetical protein
VVRLLSGLPSHSPGRYPTQLDNSPVPLVVSRGPPRRFIRRFRPCLFGFLRSRWCCESVALLMLRDHGVKVSCETIRCWLRRGGLVYRWRPTLGRKDPQRQVKLDAPRGLLAELPDDETAVFQ